MTAACRSRGVRGSLLADGLAALAILLLAVTTIAPVSRFVLQAFQVAAARCDSGRQELKTSLLRLAGEEGKGETDE